METKIQTNPQTSIEDSTVYFENRLEHIHNLKKVNINPYPHSYNITKTFDEYIKAYSNIETGTHIEDQFESLAGRCIEIRPAGKLTFITSSSSTNFLQFMIKQDLLEDSADYKNIVSKIHRGDIVGVFGFVGKSKKGELSLFVKKIQILVPCLREIPKIHFGIKDEDLRIRKRYLDLISNPKSKLPFITKNKVIKFIRKYLDDRDFMEVQTPILCPLYGGANAKPFVTYYNDLKSNFFLRIAPELYLKQLIVGGFEKVYELGSQFRNESQDHTHNPEFISLELYSAYTDYNHMLKMGEEMISSLVKVVCGDYKIKITLEESSGIKETEIDFTPPFKKIDMISELEKKTDCTFPTDFYTDEANKFLSDLCIRHKIDCGLPRTTARLIDKLVGHFIEPECINPTFVMNHPVIMSPLAKFHREKPHLTERFELFVNGFELCNAYTELNDPIIQRKTFEDQMNAKKQGDNEAQPIDETFINSLEIGLPPTGGFGLGIERLTMLLSNSNKISDVILFPSAKYL